MLVFNTYQKGTYNKKVPSGNLSLDTYYLMVVDTQSTFEGSKQRSS